MSYCKGVATRNNYSGCSREVDSESVIWWTDSVQERRHLCARHIQWLRDKGVLVTSRKVRLVTTDDDALDALGEALDDAGLVLTLNGKPMHKPWPVKRKLIALDLVRSHWPNITSAARFLREDGERVGEWCDRATTLALDIEVIDTAMGVILASGNEVANNSRETVISTVGNRSNHPKP